MNDIFEKSGNNNDDNNNKSKIYDRRLHGAEGGLSLDLEPADKEPKNQNWLF